MTPAPGGPAPELRLPDQFGEEVTLASFRGQAHVLLVFFPFAFSRVCTGELAELSARRETLTAAGVQPMAVSCDPMYALAAWAEAEGYDFPLLSDFWPHGEAAARYGVFADGPGRAERGSFLIDDRGTLRWSLVVPPGEHRPWAAYLDALATLDAPPGG